VEGRGVARYKSAARDLGAFICFEDEAGQGLSPPKGRTWAPRGARPVVRVRGAGGGRVSIAGVACYRPGDRPHLFHQLHFIPTAFQDPYPCPAVPVGQQDSGRLRRLASRDGQWNSSVIHRLSP
jgi:hypothetical protein